MNEVVSSVLYWAGDHWVAILAFIALFVEITPIKINPIRSFLEWIGKYITKDIKKDNEEIKTEISGMKTEMTDLKGNIAAIEEKADINEIDRIRWEILNFANSCRNGVRHTKDEFEHIITIEDKYSALIDKYHITNGVFKEEYAYIMKIYHKCQDQNDFL